MHLDNLLHSLNTWFMRRTNNSAVRRVSELPVAIGTDIGKVRKENQDRVGILRAQDDLGQPFIVGALCDGMGGMAEGSACASLAISAFLVSCYRHRSRLVRERLLESAAVANEIVFSQYAGRGGSTLSAFVIDSSGGFTGVNVGDSRIYSISHEINQLTVDDTIAGQFGGNKIIGDHGRNELLQFVGMGKDIQPHLIDFPATSQQALILLTSDGIHFLAKEIMQSIGMNASEPAIAVKRLIELSKWCGGSDNGSVIAATQFFIPPTLEKSAPNVIEIWDASGELQLIDFNTSPQSSLKVATLARTPSNQNPKVVIAVANNTKQPKVSKAVKQTKAKAPAKRIRRSKQKALLLGDAELTNNDARKSLSPKLIVEFNKVSED